MDIRTYVKSDKDALVQIFHSNCPRYFVESDESDFVDFLDVYADENYLVAEVEGKVIGCGGHYTKGDIHGIAWVMFESGSIGTKQLLSTCDEFYQAIEQRIEAEGKLYNIVVYTTQLMIKLFSRYGFEVGEVTKDGFGEGLDEVQMIKRFQ